jgi:hypothetical protein
MAFTLQALIGDIADVMSIAPDGVPVVALPQSKALLPLIERMREERAIPFLPLTDEGVGEVPKAIEELAARAKKVAYVEAEFFGGDGTQAAAIWEEGRLVFGPIVADDAINQGLRQLGIAKQGAFDEFAALNLGRHRDTEDWR